MANSEGFDLKMEKLIPAPSETLSLPMTEKECYLVINALDMYSRIWIGQYDRINDLSIYDTGNQWNRDSCSYAPFQRLRSLLIPSLKRMGDYLSCSLGIWSDETDIRAVNAYDIQQRLRYEVSWFKNPEGGMTVNYNKPLIRGSLGDCSVFCMRDGGGISAYLYLSQEQLVTIRTSLEVYEFLTEGNIKAAFAYFTSDEDALAIAEELTTIYGKYPFLSYSSDKDFGKMIYYDLKDELTKLLAKIKSIIGAGSYVDMIRVNVMPANPFLSSEEIMKILDMPFEHFKKTRRKNPPADVLKRPGAGFLTGMYPKERSTTDYLLVWYEAESKTEYYYAGEDYVFKHEGKLDLPEDIRKYIRNKCNAARGA